jgi:hypothetical protein
MTPSLDFFLPLVGSIFTIETQAGLVELTLVEATESPRRGLPEQFRTPLSLIFSGPLSMILSQDNYFADHPAMARQAWLIAPIMGAAQPYLSAVPAPQEAFQRYQVLFC